jgi:hypothetical protein
VIHSNPRIQLDAVRELERSEDLLGELLDDGLDAVTQAGPEVIGTNSRSSAQVFDPTLKYHLRVLPGRAPSPAASTPGSLLSLVVSSTSPASVMRSSTQPRLSKSNPTIWLPSYAVLTGPPLDR